MDNSTNNSNNNSNNNSKRRMRRRMARKNKKNQEVQQLVNEETNPNNSSGSSGNLSDIIETAQVNERNINRLRRKMHEILLLEEEIKDEELLKVHRGLLKHKEWRARADGLDKAYKIKKRYGSSGVKFRSKW